MAANIKLLQLDLKEKMCHFFWVEKISRGFILKTDFINEGKKITWGKKDKRY